MPEKPKLQTPSQTSEAGRTTHFQLCKPLLLVLPLAGALPVLVNLSAHTEFDRCLSATDIELVAVVSYMDASPPIVLQSFKPHSFSKGQCLPLAGTEKSGLNC